MFYVRVGLSNNTATCAKSCPTISHAHVIIIIIIIIVKQHSLQIAPDKKHHNTNQCLRMSPSFLAGFPNSRHSHCTLLDGAESGMPPACSFTRTDRARARESKRARESCAERFQSDMNLTTHHDTPLPPTSTPHLMPYHILTHETPTTPTLLSPPIAPLSPLARHLLPCCTHSPRASKAKGAPQQQQPSRRAVPSCAPATATAAASASSRWAPSSHVAACCLDKKVAADSSRGNTMVWTPR